MEKNHLIIFEKSMNERFIQIAKVNNISYTTLNFENIKKGGLFLSVINRIRYRKHFKKKIYNLIDCLEKNKPDQILLSNIEGFIGYSGSKILKQRLPKMKIIALQHGIFSLEHDFIKHSVIKFINNIFFFFFGIAPLGQGFGGFYVDKYIVFGKLEKSFLIKFKGWDANKVEVDIKFLKSYLSKNNQIELNRHERRNSAIFLLQNLSESNLCKKTDEIELINKTIFFLSEKHQTVYLKDHPFCRDRIKEFKIPNNVFVINDMLEGFMKSEIAYSFFSTALIDAKLFDLKTYAIISKKIKIKKSVYKVFDNIINFENEIDT